MSQKSKNEISEKQENNPVECWCWFLGDDVTSRLDPCSFQRVCMMSLPVWSHVPSRGFLSGVSLLYDVTSCLVPCSFYTYRGEWVCLQRGYGTNPLPFRGQTNSSENITFPHPQLRWRVVTNAMLFMRSHKNWNSDR